MGYQNYAGAWLTQSNGAYDWLANQWQTAVLSPGIDTVKIWQSYVLPDNVNNVIVFGDGNYAAGNNQDNVLQTIGAHDLIYGGRGNDVFVGSGGSGTTFIVAQAEGDKVIQNFTEGSDTLRLIGGPLTSFAAVQGALSQRGADVVLNDGGTMIEFRNANVGQFSENDFQLPLNSANVGAATFIDDFNSTSTIGTTWATNYGFAGAGLYSFTLPGNGEQQIYTNASFQGTSGAPLGLNPFSVSGGVLTISAQPVTAAQSAQMWGYKYSSGMLESSFSQTYGYFEVRAELPHGQGLWPAFWLIGENNKEIDVLEGLGSDTKVANNALHSAAVPAIGNASFNPYGDGFHSYGVLWDPQHVTYYVDGTPVWQTATPSDMNTPMHMIVNLAVGGNWPGSPDGSTPWPAQMKIDYVHVYSLAAAPGSTGAGASTGGGGTPGSGTSPGTTAGTSTITTSQLLVSGYAGASLVGGAGNDTLVASQGADQLTGGAGADTFIFKMLPWSAGHITDFQVGADKLDISALYANGYTGSNPVADGYVSFVSNGVGGTKVLLDTDGSANGNTLQYLITTLDGVSPTSLTAANVFGSSGTAPSISSGQLLVSSYPGASLVGGSGNDTLVASQGADQLTGGAGADTFLFKALPWSASHITDFQVGTDKLDISALYANGYNGSNPIADGFVSFVSNGVGGTKVLLDTDGTANGNTIKFLITTLDGIAPTNLTAANVFGSNGATPAASSNQLLVATTGASVLGGSGNDTIVASQGADQLTGGGGSDTFVFKALPWSAGHITDFQPGVDILDLRALFSAIGYAGPDPMADGTLAFASDGAGDTRVLFHPAGASWSTVITTLNNVEPYNLHSGDWLIH